MTHPGQVRATAARSLLQLWTLALFVFAAALHGAPAAPEKRASFDIPAGDVIGSFRQFSDQSGVQLLYAVDAVKGARTNAVKGEYTVREAIDLMLEGTGLAAQQTSGGAMAVMKRKPGDPKVPGATQEPGSRANNPEAGAGGGSELVELSPFMVNTSRDLGYEAENTLAGSRLNTRLRDTAASISVFTAEFLADLGVTDMADLMKYTVNAQMNSADQVAGYVQNDIINSYNLTRSILVRGMNASQGIDYFNSITPIDPYRLGRYEDSRGPNSILFGIGSPGGMLNQSSKVAVLNRDSASLRYGFGSWNRSRGELDVNRVLRSGKLAASISALHQENGGWRNFDFKDSRRIFGSLTYRPLPQLTIQAMGETGKDHLAVITSYTQLESMLAWYDNRQAKGVDAVTFTPTLVAPNAAQVALGVATRNGAVGGVNHRFIYIENNEAAFDAVGSYLTASYNTANVVAPDGTKGTTGTPLRLSDPAFYPYFNNAGGPGMYRDQSLGNYTLSADWQVTRDLFLNLAHNHQETRATVYINTGDAPTLRGEPNRTLGVNGPANPYAGMLYFDGDWSRHFHEGTYRETRLSASYKFDTRSPWLGRHRIALMASRNEQYDRLYVAFLAVAGRPFNSDPINANNRVMVRNYITEGDYGTYRVGDWRSLPKTVSIGGRIYETTFANAQDIPRNYAGLQTTDCTLGVLHSEFLNGRLVATLGSREDRAEIASFGYSDDPVQGKVIDPDPAKRTVYHFTGRTHTAGLVFHLRDWVSLIANRSSSVGIPSFQTNVFPDGGLAGPPDGQGSDYGLRFELLNGRLNARFVTFTTDQIGMTGAAGSGQFNPRNVRVMDAFASVLVGPGRPLSQAEWDPLYRRFNIPVGGSTFDMKSKGYEANITANITPQWRLMANYSYTDYRRENMFKEALPWYGFKPADRGLVMQGVSQDSSGQLVIDPNAFEPGGAMAKWIELGAMSPQADPTKLMTSGNQTVAQEMFFLADFINTQKQEQEKRWGLRPHKVSLFTAYDFKRGVVKGLSVGGGGSWRSANVIGTTSAGEEIAGKVITSTDLMLRYVLRPNRLPGQLSFQLNMYNVFNRTDMIPQRLSTSVSAPDGFVLPGGRGLAYSRFDVVAPREMRFTTTWSF